MRLTAALGVLLALAVAGLLWQTYQRGMDSATRESLTTSANQQQEVLAEVRALSKDTQKRLAEIRAVTNNAMHKGKNVVNRCALICKPIRALTLWCLLLSLTVCNDDKAAIGDLYLRRLQRINAAVQGTH